jgi:hypothetical protein
MRREAALSKTAMRRFPLSPDTGFRKEILETFGIRGRDPTLGHSKTGARIDEV